MKLYREELEEKNLEIDNLKFLVESYIKDLAKTKLTIDELTA